MSKVERVTLARLVRHALQSNRRRVRTVVIGVLMCSLLILVLLATFRNVSLGIVAYAGRTDVHLWVTPLGTDNLVRSSAVLRDTVVEELEAIDGVRMVTPIIRSFVSAQSVDGLQRATLLALGYPGSDGPGGPTDVYRGHAPERALDITIDRAAAYRLGVDLGQELTVNGQSMKVSGITRRTNLMATQFAFMKTTQAELSSGFKDRVSFIAVTLEENTVENSVISAIEALPGLSVFSRAAWVENNLQEVAAGFRPMMVLVTTVGLITAIVLVVLLVQSLVDDRRSEIAVLLAMGVPYPVISRGIIIHVARLVSFGAVLGGACSVVMSMAFEKWVPAVELQASAADVLGVILSQFIIGVVASILPTRRLRTIDPIEAFRP